MYCITEKNPIQDEHNYSRKRHYDHTYCKEVEVEERHGM